MILRVKIQKLQITDNRLLIAGYNEVRSKREEVRSIKPESANVANQGNKYRGIFSITQKEKLHPSSFFLHPFLFAALLVVVFSFNVNAQIKGTFKVDEKQVQLERADELIGIKMNGRMVNKLIGSVVFRQGNVMLYCDSAYQHDEKNEVECFGRVRLTQGDTIQLTGKKLHYFGNTGVAIVTDNVVLKDRQMTLTTNYLDYNTKTKIASYHGGGKIIDKENILTSDIGYYSTASKIFWFKKNVVAINTKEESTLTSDTLEYNSNNGIATFRGPSKVVKKTDVLYADHGKYDTRKAQSVFTGRAKVETGEYIMEGDRLFFDEKLKAGAGEGRVIMFSKKDKIIIQGDEVRYWGKDGIIKVYGTPLMKTKLEKDTLYLTADTLISIDRPLASDTTKREKYLRAFKKAKLFKGEMQAVCDSLVYNQQDSVIHFFTKPTIWNGKSQIIADSIRAFLKNQKIHRIECVMDAFVITQDTILNFNQVAGKYITTYFNNESKIHQVNVKVNSRTLYFPLDEKKNNQLVGMNRADCSNILVRFKDGKFSTVTYLKKPDAKMIPPKEIKEEEKTLEGFEWRIDLRPSFAEVGGVRPPQAIPFIPGSVGDTLFRNDTLASVPVPDSLSASADSTIIQIEKDNQLDEKKKEPVADKLPAEDKNKEDVVLTEKQKKRLERKAARKKKKLERKKKRNEAKLKKLKA